MNLLRQTLNYSSEDLLCRPLLEVEFRFASDSGKDHLACSPRKPLEQALFSEVWVSGPAGGCEEQLARRSSDTEA